MTIDYHAILPVLILSGTIVIVLITDLFLSPRHKSASMWVAFVGVLATLVAVLHRCGWPSSVCWRPSSPCYR